MRELSLNILDITQNSITACSTTIMITVGITGNLMTITITDNGIKIEMTIGSTTAYVNGTEIVLDTAPEIRNDRTLVPVRFIAESFELNVDWDEASNSIIIE